MNKTEAKNILKQTGYIGNEVGVAFDVAIKSMDKLEKIEQIVNKWISLEERPNFCMMEIREVLEQE